MKKAFLFSILLASSTAFAAQDKIVLNGGTVSPQQPLVVSLDQLAKDELYKIKCSINSTAPSDIEVMKFYMNFGGGAKVDGATLNGQNFEWDHAKLDPTIDNVIATGDFVSYGSGNSFVFENTTSDYSYTVNYCEAIKVNSEETPTTTQDNTTDTNKETTTTGDQETNNTSTDNNNAANTENTNSTTTESKEAADNTNADSNSSADTNKDNTDSSNTTTETKENSDPTNTDSNNNDSNNSTADSNTDNTDSSNTATESKESTDSNNTDSNNETPAAE